VYDALSTPRPYRHALEPAEVFALMERDGGTGFCELCLEALHTWVGEDGGEAEEERLAA
jgi:HD-GYP domain-containing protein (c-di-GMP phosphodiesterase class II)